VAIPTQKLIMKNGILSGMVQAFAASLTRPVTRHYAGVKIKH
jgi:hypothetical protein